MAQYNIVQNNTLWYNTIISQYDIKQIKMNLLRVLQSQVNLDLSNRPENDTNKHADTKRRILNIVGIAFCGFS